MEELIKIAIAQFNPMQILALLAMFWIFRKSLDKKFEAIEKLIEKKFDAVDKRFDAVDRRFERIEEKALDIDRRLCHLQGAVLSKDCCVLKEDRRKAEGE